MTTDSTGGLHYSRDETAGVHEPQLEYSNPHGRHVGPCWVRGEIVFAMPQGIIHVDPDKQKWAKEFVVVYNIEGPDGRPERVPEQYGIYDSRPGDPNYSPVWRYSYVVVPRDYEPNALRSEEDILNSGYEVVQADIYTN